MATFSAIYGNAKVLVLVLVLDQKVLGTYK